MVDRGRAMTVLLTPGQADRAALGELVRGLDTSTLVRVRDWLTRMRYRLAQRARRDWMAPHQRSASAWGAKELGQRLRLVSAEVDRRRRGAGQGGADEVVEGEVLSSETTGEKGPPSPAGGGGPGVEA